LGPGGKGKKWGGAKKGKTRRNSLGRGEDNGGFTGWIKPLGNDLITEHCDHMQGEIRELSPDILWTHKERKSVETKREYLVPT